MAYEEVELSRIQGQVIQNGHVDSIVWDTLNLQTSTFVPSGPPFPTTDTITIPSAKGGVYSGFFDLITSASNFLNVIARLNINGILWDLQSGPNASNPLSRWLVPMPPAKLSAGDSMKLLVSNEHGSAATFTGRLQLYRLAS